MIIRPKEFELAGDDAADDGMSSRRRCPDHPAAAVALQPDIRPSGKMVATVIEERIDPIAGTALTQQIRM